VHRIFKVAVQKEAPMVQPQPIVVEEKHPEIEIGVDTEKEELKELAEGKPISEVLESEGEVTKVTIEKGGQIIAQETYSREGQAVQSHRKIGRNDPCWCGRKKSDGKPVKYKHCHYPN